jgi:hypothetical protein
MGNCGVPDSFLICGSVASHALFGWTVSLEQRSQLQRGPYYSCGCSEPSLFRRSLGVASCEQASRLKPRSQPCEAFLVANGSAPALP